MRLRSDEHLVSLFRAGREEAFETCTSATAGACTRRPRARCAAQGGEPEGVVQEAFLRAHRTLREDRRPIELKPWLHRVVRNLCIDELRRNRLAHHRARGRRPRRRGRGRLQHAQPPPRAAAADRGPRRPARAAAGGAADARARRAQPRGGRQRAGRLARRLAPARQARPQRAGRGRRGARRRVRRDPRRAPDRARREAPAVRARAAPPQDLRGLPRVPRGPEGDAGQAARARAADRHGPARRRAGPSAGGGGRTTKVAAPAAAAPWSPRAAPRRLAGRRAPRRHAAPRPGHRGRRQDADRQADPPRHQAARRTSRSPTSPSSWRPARAIRPRVICPPGMVSNGPRAAALQDGKVATGRLRMYQLSDRDMDLLERPARAAGPRSSDYARSSATPLVISVGTLCKRR